MAAIVIDSPRWREGWGEAPREGWGQPLAPAPRPELRLVGDGTRGTDARVYRRRRLVALVVVAIVLLVATVVGTAALSRPATAGVLPQGRQTHVVEAGETYWSIAADRHHGSGDLRVEVDQLIDANGGRALFAGDRIELP
jgi:hypothetical protein